MQETALLCEGPITEDVKYHLPPLLINHSWCNTTQDNFYQDWETTGLLEEQNWIQEPHQWFRESKILILKQAALSVSEETAESHYAKTLPKQQKSFCLTLLRKDKGIHTQTCM